MTDREERREAKREKVRAERQFSFAAIRMEALMGKQRHSRWDGSHLEQHAQPLSVYDPASDGLERVYPHPRPYPPVLAEYSSVSRTAGTSKTHRVR
eukprot:4816124-Amphidinium_carterae.1